jgi:hypothetical protein
VYAVFENKSEEACNHSELLGVWTLENATFKKLDQWEIAGKMYNKNFDKACTNLKLRKGCGNFTHQIHETNAWD